MVYHGMVVAEIHRQIKMYLVNSIRNYSGAPATPQVMSVCAANAPAPRDLHFIFLNEMIE